MSAWKTAILVSLLLICGALRESALRLTDPAWPSVRADAADYFFYTINLRRHGVYSRENSLDGGAPAANDFLRSPGLPLLALPFAGEAETLVPDFLRAQTIASVAAGALVFWAGLKLAGFWAGCIALLLYAIGPHLINANLYFLTESPTATALICFAASLTGGFSSRSRSYWFLMAGLFLGIATLLRPYLLGFAPVLLAFLWLKRKQIPGRAAAMTFAGLLLTLAPWQVFKASSDTGHHDSLFLSSVVHGSYPDFMYQGLRESFGYPYRYDPQSPDTGRGTVNLLSELLARAEERPADHLRWYLVGKPVALWQWPLVQGAREAFIYPVVTTPFDYLPHMQAAWWLSRALHYPAVLLACAGCLFAWSRRGSAALAPPERNLVQVMGLLFLWTTALHVVAAPFPRYHMPLKPLLFIVAAWALVRAYREATLRMSAR